MDRVTCTTRRMIYFVPVTAMIMAAMTTMYQVVAPGGVTFVEWALFALFSISFLSIAMWFWNAVLGAIIRVFSANPARLASPILSRLDRSVPVAGRTAIVMPIYNEDPARTFKRLEQTWLSVERTGTVQNFDFFLLSDTTNLAIAEQEIVCLAALHRRLGHENIRYRRRDTNTGRKAGNIADFGRQWGRDYDYLVVLDADSVMSGNLITDLVRLMDQSPQTGIIQTAPRPILAQTLFGRMQQFGAWVSSGIVNTGVDFWQLGSGNYFGHNAIIRSAAFFDHCKMPVLSGDGPLGGEIMSHDFVEAAWMARAGWQVWNIPVGDGSYEEIPPTIEDFAIRDRRWCQGNLQHARLLTEPGLPLMSRLHLATGVLSYISSPLWLFFIILSVLNLVDHSNPTLTYVGPGTDTFRLVPEIDNEHAFWLFTTIMAMLLTPRIFGAALIAMNHDVGTPAGSRIKLFASTILEAVSSIIHAPIMMLWHSMFVFGILGGKSSGWSAQNRDIAAPDFWHHLGTLRWHILIAGTLGLFVLAFTPDWFLMFLPLIVGPILSPLLALFTGSARVGGAFSNAGMFLTADEIQPAREVSSLTEAEAQTRSSWKRPQEPVALPLT